MLCVVKETQAHLRVAKRREFFAKQYVKDSFFGCFKHHPYTNPFGSLSYFLLSLIILKEASSRVGPMGIVTGGSSGTHGMGEP